MTKENIDLWPSVTCGCGFSMAIHPSLIHEASIGVLGKVYCPYCEKELNAKIAELSNKEKENIKNWPEKEKETSNDQLIQMSNNDFIRHQNRIIDECQDAHNFDMTIIIHELEKAISETRSEIERRPGPNHGKVGCLRRITPILELARQTLRSKSKDRT